LFHLVLRPEKLSLNLRAFFSKADFRLILGTDLNNSRALLWVNAHFLEVFRQITSKNVIFVLTLKSLNLY